MEGILLSFMVFFEGLASFLSPCVLPLVPVYMVYLTGQTADDLIQRPGSYRRLGLNALAFVLGFSFVFIAMGQQPALWEGFHCVSDIIRRVSGILIILFGLFHLGLVSFRLLDQEKRLNVKLKEPGLVTSFLVGLGFSLGGRPVSALCLHRYLF